MSDEVSDAELRRSYLFADLSDKQLTLVRRNMGVIQLDEGQHLFDHGQDATSVVFDS